MNNGFQQQQQCENILKYFKETTNKTVKHNNNKNNNNNHNNNHNSSNHNGKLNKICNNCNKICCQSNNTNSNNETSNTNNGQFNGTTTTTTSITTLGAAGSNDDDSNNCSNLKKKSDTTLSSSLSSTSWPPPLAATANDCDKRNFDRITFNSSNQLSTSSSSSCNFVTEFDTDSVADSLFVVVQDIPSTSLVQLKITKNRKHFPTTAATSSTSASQRRESRTFQSSGGRSACQLRAAGFYRILFLCLQLSAALFSFSLNIGFALAANSIDDDDFNAINGGWSGSGSATGTGSGEYGDDDSFGHYTHTWAVHIPNGEESGLANSVARDHGFVNLGKIFDDHYHFSHHKVSRRSLRAANVHQSKLDDDDRVHWSKQQRAKSRQKRDFMRVRPSRTSPRALSLVDAVVLNDPKWPQMWYLNRGGGLDMNVIPAWKEGITGKGIVVTILDDGLESDHPDIEHNYDPLASYDVNSHDNDPMPHYDMTDSNRHGTRCAGEVAATANNSICAVGIAFGASVGGVRMLDGDVTDAVEARSLSLNPQHIDIYSASWGPDDDGKTVDGPGELASRAFIEGVTKGRGGKGSIFIWASGNGGRELDNCNCDGYTNSIWTLSISSATEDGHVPWYSEKCSSTLATTYSSGSQGEKQVVTTDLHHSCTVSHTGTSASAPLAAGIAALVLESNKNLTWRDLQHIVVRTAKPANLKDQTWSKNGVGRRISHSFGYGLMDAAAMVRVAKSWKTVPEQQRCEINAPHVDKTIPAEGYITLQLAVKHCMSVNYLEHVQAKITLTSQRRGDIQLFLRSPAGTKVTLLTNRMHDNSRSGFSQWPFMSVHTWGESPHGNWQLEIHNEGRFKAQITQWDLIFYGTDVPAQPEDQVHISSGKYNSFGSEMEHNDIEFDASGQWHNMQQIGESAVKSHDRTNSACIKSTIDQKCLACAPPNFLFNNRCYDECPLHTFEITSNLDGEPQQEHISEISDNSISKLSEQPEEQLVSVDKRSEQNDENKMTRTKSSSRECHICDTSCYECSGPLNSQCINCYAGGQLRKLRNESFCYNFAERSTKNRGGGGENSNSNFFEINPTEFSTKLILTAAMLVVFVVFIVVFIVYRQEVWRTISASNKVHYTYDRVALLTENEETELEATINEQENKVQHFNKKSILHTNTDSETEEEVDIFNININNE